MSKDIGFPADGESRCADASANRMAQSSDAHGGYGARYFATTEMLLDDLAEVFAAAGLGLLI